MNQTPSSSDRATSQSCCDTGEKILDAACHLFARNGYRDTTIAMICREAQANIAAVNYHFGCKENLYREAWRHAHQQALAIYAPDGGVAPDRPAAERLRGRIRSGLRRALHGDGIALGIMRNEMAYPTGLLHQVINDAIRPLREATQAIVRELLGPQATPFDVELCEVCVVAPWIHITHRHMAEKHEGLAPVFRENMLEDMVEHMTAYALAGIRETRRRIEQRASIATPGAEPCAQGQDAGLH